MPTSRTIGSTRFGSIPAPRLIAVSLALAEHRRAARVQRALADADQDAADALIADTELEESGFGRQK